MQERHSNRKLYFRELSFTCKNYYTPYIQQWHKIEAGMRILEIGCGEGGNLLPFAYAGCLTTGIDIATCRIEEAKHFFSCYHAKGRFMAADIFSLADLGCKYDIIICHDVIEHVEDKEMLLSIIRHYLNEDGVAFISFPAWQMPFGGHQQICKSIVLSHLPFIHLLPDNLYRTMIRLFGEDAGCIMELLTIKHRHMMIEPFERMVSDAELMILNRQLWLINPHYHIKFGLHPRKLPHIFSNIPYLRNFLSSSCFYMLSCK